MRTRVDAVEDVGGTSSIPRQAGERLSDLVEVWLVKTPLTG
jgi:hypothetical protein